MDRFLGLLEAQQFSRMSMEATFKDVGCKDAVDGFPLCGGSPEGTNKSVLLMSGCTPWFVYSRGELEMNLTAILASGEPFFLFAVGDMAAVPLDVIPNGVVGWTGSHDVILRRAGPDAYEINIELDEEGGIQSVTDCAQDLWKQFRPVLPPK